MRKIINLCFVFFVCFNTSVFSQFIENNGQILDWDENFHPEVQYLYGSDNNSMFFESNRVVCTFSSTDKFDFSKYEGNQDAIDSIYKTLGREVQRIDIEFIGATSDCKIVAGEKNTNYINYFLNKRSSITNVGSYQSICYKNIYPNIDIVFNQYDGGLKYDVVLHAGANIEDVKIKYNGAHSLELIEGKIKIKTKFYNFEELIPEAYYNDNREEKAQVYYELTDDIIRFKCDYKNINKLVIDPTITWMTYFETASSSGQISYDHNTSDEYGNLFISGYCNNSANDYPTVSPGGTAYVQNYTLNDLYIVRFNSDRELVWATYFGGSNSSMDWQLGTEPLAVDGTTLHVVGDELATNGPFLNGGGFYYNAGSSRPYYARFNKFTGQLLHCTNISGGYKPSIAVSSNGQVAIVCDAYDFNTVHVVNRSGAYNQSINGGYRDMFLMLLNSSYNQIWGTFLGGPGTQEDCHVAFDNSNNIFFVSEVSWTSSTSNATNEHLVNLSGAYYQSTCVSEDIMIGKFSSTGALVWNTLYGGNGYDGLKSRMGNGTNIVINDINEIVVLGGTNSNNLPLRNLSGAYNQTVPSNVNNSGGSFNDFGSFILKFSNSGVMQWATYWGGDPSGGDLLYDGKFTSCDKFIVCARSNTYSTMPVPGHYNKSSGGQSYLMQFDENFAAEWSSYVGNSTSTPNISFSAFEDRLYLTTSSYSQTEATVNPGGGAFFDGSATASSYTIWEFNIIPMPVLSDDIEVCQGQSVELTASGGIGSTYYWYTTETGGTPFYEGASYITPSLTGDVTYWVSSSNGSCTSARVPIIVTVTPFSAPTSVTVSPSSVCSGTTTNITLTASGGDSGPGAVVEWFTGGCGNTLIGTANPLVISQTFNSATTYYARYSGDCGTTGCQSTVVDVSASLTPTFTALGPYCLGETILALPTTSNNGITGTWSPALNDTATTTYTFTPTTGQCASNASMVITINPIPTVDIINHTGSTEVVCSVSHVDVTATGGGTYAWNGGSSPNTAANSFTTGGTYTVTVTDAGCTATESITITEAPSDLTLAVSTTQLFCNGDCDATATAIANGGTSPYTYTWSNGQTGAMISNLCAGTYTVTVEDANGCSFDGIIPPVTSCFEITDILVNSCGGLQEGLQEMVTLQVGPSDLNTSTLDIVWPTSGNLWLGVCTDPTFVANVNATITGGGQLIEPVGGVIPANSEVLIITSTALDESALDFTNLDHDVYVVFQCAGNTDGHFGNSSSNPNSARQLEVSFGSGCVDVVEYYPYYLDNIDGASVAYTADGSVSYYNNGCVAPVFSTTEAVIVAPPALTVNATNNGPLCEGESLSLTGGDNGYADYDWSGPDGYTNSTQNPSVSGSAIIDMAGTYTLTVTDENACTATATTEVIINAPTIPTFSFDTEYCLDAIAGSLPDTSDNGYQGTWSPSTIGTATAGSYSYTFTPSSSLCVTTTSMDIEIVEIDLNVSMSGSQCYGENGSFSFTASGGSGTYSYTVNGSSATSPYLAVAGNYTVVVSDGTCSASQDIIITDAELLVAYYTKTEVTCNGGNNGGIDVTVEGGVLPYSFAWSDGNVTTEDRTGLVSGTYSVVVTDANGCSASINNINIIQPSAVNVVGVISHVACYNGSTGGIVTTTIGGNTGGYTYSWSSSQQTANIIGVIAGTYTVTATDSQGCTGTANFVITQPDAISISSQLSHPICNAQTNGGVVLTVSGGSPNYTYQWNPAGTGGSATQNLSGVGAGIYNVTITDSHSCTTTAMYTITEPSAISISKVVVNTSCDLSNGSISLNVTGGTSDYFYQWDANAMNATTSTVSNLVNQDYTVTVTDANQCSIEETIAVGRNIPPTLNLVEQINETCSDSNGRITVEVVGGSPNYTYLWMGNQGLNDSVFSNVPAGNHVVIVTDADGCVDSLSIVITNHEPPEVGIASIIPAHCDQSDAEISLEVIAGSGNYTYDWGTIPPRTSIHETDLPSGQYTVTVSDGVCDIEMIVDVPNLPGPSVNASANPNEVYVSNELVRFNDGSIGATSWYWDYGTGEYSQEQTPSYKYEMPGNYDVVLTVTDNYGCSASDTVNVIVHEALEVWIPNAFSPDSDGLNELFGPVAIGMSLEGYEMEIYDRWGKQAFYTNDYYHHWDGTINGSKVTMNSVFVYRIVIYDKMGKDYIYTGRISLIRGF